MAAVGSFHSTVELKRERGQGNIYFPCSADHEQNWQLYPPVVRYSCSIYNHILCYKD